MKIHQLSLFLENKPGQLRAPCRLLAEAGINIRTLMLADSEQFGILRLLVSDWQRAKALLEQAGHVVKVTEVLAVQVPDQPGGLDKIVAVAEEAGMNVEYMYAFTYGQDDRATLIFRFDVDADSAAQKLRARGIDLRDLALEL